ncbi:DUF5638 domain-containing protein [uncultured Legionella sp.]|uniref:DUF5638 domain-containing protein n=1 Tax=uncultured Legionella sp. TaxID=210934 RepID=UPI0026272A33|nr:DUF5638 domain-containing protein [uncultured Legionella sp.]
MVNNKFRELDKNFFPIHMFLDTAKTPNTLQNTIIVKIMGEDTHFIEQADIELTQIRTFYCERFYSAASKSEKSEILASYQEFYELYVKIAKNELTIENAEKQIRQTIHHWGDKITVNNLLHSSLVIACALPLVAGITILPFVLPVMVLDFFLGTAILTATLSSIILGVSQGYNSISNIEDDKIPTRNKLTELSFLHNMNHYHTQINRLRANQAQEETDDYSVDLKTSNYI